MLVDAWDNSVCFASIAALYVVAISVLLCCLLWSLAAIRWHWKWHSWTHKRHKFRERTLGLFLFVAALPLFRIDQSDFKRRSEYSKSTGHFVTMKWQIGRAAQWQSFYFPQWWEASCFLSFRSRWLWRCFMNGCNV